MKTIVYIILLCALVGCTSTPPASSPSGGSPAGTSALAKPDRAKAVLHVREHVKFPASREAILAACADTPEFSAGEKKWFADNLPAGEYKSAEEVVKALKL
jgi:hypothetical protein